MAAATADVAYVGFLLGHGGDALQMLELARGTRDSGASVRIIVPQTPESISLEERCRALGIECERTPLISVSMEGARQPLHAVHQLLRSIREPIVHFHTGNSRLPRAVMLSLEALRYRKGLVTLQSPYETISPGSVNARFWALTARRRFFAVVSPSVHATRFQHRCGIPQPIGITIRNSIDVDAMSGGDPRVPRQLLGVGPDQSIVVFTSRIDAQKRPVDAVRIFAAAADVDPGAVLVLVGQGDERHAVEAEAARLDIVDRVRLVGYQTNIADWLAAATVWLLPTERENFSVAVLEALAAGCAVLSTDCQGNDEVLVDGENSLTFPVGDVARGADALRTLMVDGGLRRRLADEARKTAQAYTVANMVEQYRVVYNRSPDVPSTLHTEPAAR